MNYMVLITVYGTQHPVRVSYFKADGPIHVAIKVKMHLASCVITSWLTVI